MERAIDSIIEKSVLSPPDFAIVAKAHVAAAIFAEIAKEVAKRLERSRFSQVSLRAQTSREDRKKRLKRRK